MLLRRRVTRKLFRIDMLLQLLIYTVSIVLPFTKKEAGYKHNHSTVSVAARLVSRRRRMVNSWGLPEDREEERVDR